MKDEPMSPLSPSKVSEMRKNKKFKLMEKDQKCLVWDEETAAFKTRRERGRYLLFFLWFVQEKKSWLRCGGRGWGVFAVWCCR